MFKYKNIFTLFIAASLLFAVGCEDPEDAFDPKNPELSEDAILGTNNSAQKVLDGAERQLSLAMDEVIINAEIASDNYINTQTFFNQFLDDLNVDATDDDLDDMQFDIHRLRELALAGLTTFGPADPNYTPNQEAEFNFMAGFSHLLAGELFKSLPAMPGGPVMSPTDHLNAALRYFNDGLAVVTEPFTETSLQLGIARAHYGLGNQPEAVTAADAAIALDPAFVRYANFDAVNGPTNTMQDGLWDRGSFDDLQPLPRLDFLDPKYNGSNATQEFNAPILKIEEAHLILAEAALADEDLPTAQAVMLNIIGLVDTRPLASVPDAVEGRIQNDPGSRPDTAIVTVAASPDDPQRAGLVLDRNEGVNVDVPAVSGTSVTTDMVNTLNDLDDALETLYLMRQEIFIAEGRRMTDLGIRLVTSQVEFLSNDNVAESDLDSNLPPFIEAVRESMDAFTYDKDNYTCTIAVNLNRVLVENKDSDEVLPFH